MNSIVSERATLRNPSPEDHFSELADKYQYIRPVRPRQPLLSIRLSDLAFAKSEETGRRKQDKG